jgi:hydroxyacylglutathione hydrolase
MAKEDFVRMMTTDLPEAPAYFPRDAEINRAGAPALEEIPRPAELTPEEVDEMSRQGVVVLDVRSSAAFGNGHVPTAINIGLGGQFASWAGALIPMGAPIIVVADEPAQIDEAVTRLARVGIESVKGHLGGGMLAWDKAGLPTATRPQIAVDELKRLIDEEADLQIIDVRRPGEYNAGHAPGAINAQLAGLEKSLAQFDPHRQTAVICASGYRSSAATGILARHGFENLFNVVGGTSAWINAGYPVEGAETSGACQQ